MTHRIFIDTGYLLALFNPRDKYHGQATSAAARIAQEEAILVTTDAVLIEICNGLANRATRSLASQIARDLRESAAVEIVHVDIPLIERGLDYYEKRGDKDWGLTDCISFVVMQQRGITDALATDRHFQQAGFRMAM